MIFPGGEGGARWFGMCPTSMQRCPWHARKGKVASGQFASRNGGALNLSASPSFVCRSPIVRHREFMLQAHSICRRRNPAGGRASLLSDCVALVEVPSKIRTLVDATFIALATEDEVDALSVI